MATHPEDRSQKLARFYALLRRINQAMVRHRDLDSLLSSSCAVAAEESRFVLTWVGRLDPATRRVAVVASSGTAQSYLEKINIDLGDPQRSNGPTGRAVLQGSHVICNDVATDPTLRPWRTDLVALGVRSSGAFPLRVGGEIWGAFTIYSAELNFFDVEEIQLLDELAADLSFAIEMIAQDLQRQLAERELRESEGRLRQVSQAINEVFWLTDTTKGEILFVSQAYETIWGRSVESLYASPVQWVEAIHPEDRDRVLEAARTRQTEGTYDEEYRIFHVDGSVRWIRDHAFPIHDEAGRVYRVAGVAENITRRKESEAQRGGLEAQLLQAQKLESLGVLASGIAHDFNNLLGIILGHTTMAKAFHDQPALVDKSLEAISQAGTRGAQLVRQLLTFARKNEPNDERLELNALVTEVHKLLLETLPSNLEVLLSLSFEPLPLQADGSQLHQVLLNLCINSRDAMPAGGKLTVSTRTEKVDGQAWAVMSVRDTGTGMDETTRRNLFEPFFTTKQPGKGTGLGLAVVFGIIQSHRGHIEVESSPGRGTLMECWLPLLTGAGTENVEAPVELSAVPATPGKTVLIIEDEPMLRELLEEFLAETGYRVVSAADGLEGLARFDENPLSVDVVISDFGLPKLGGEEVFRNLRARRVGLPMLFVSGALENEPRARLELEGRVEFLQKPYELRELAAVVQRLCALER